MLKIIAVKIDSLRYFIFGVWQTFARIFANDECSILYSRLKFQSFMQDFSASLQRHEPLMTILCTGSYVYHLVHDENHFRSVMFYSYFTHVRFRRTHFHDACYL
jgi:hypothetical protein